MTDFNDKTTLFRSDGLQERTRARAVLQQVYTALEAKGYNPVNQLVGYLISGDPTFITSHNNARSLITSLERDIILEEIIDVYLSKGKGS